MVHELLFDSDFLNVFGQEKEWRRKKIGKYLEKEKEENILEGKYFLSVSWTGRDGLTSTAL